MSEKRTVDEIAAAHAKAMDDLWAFLYPGNISIGKSAKTILEDAGPERYFRDWAPEDMSLVQTAITKKGHLR